MKSYAIGFIQYGERDTRKMVAESLSDAVVAFQRLAKRQGWKVEIISATLVNG